jgi:hypothetical protein
LIPRVLSCSELITVIVNRPDTFIFDATLANGKVFSFLAANRAEQQQWQAALAQAAGIRVGPGF